MGAKNKVCRCPSYQGFTLAKVRAHAEHVEAVAAKHGEAAALEHVDCLIYAAMDAIARGDVRDPVKVAQAIMSIDLGAL